MKKPSVFALLAVLAAAGAAEANGREEAAQQPKEGAAERREGEAEKSAKADAQKSAPSRPTGEQASGTIRTLDKRTRVLTLESAGRTHELKVPETATVFVDGRIGAWQDLKEGQKVRAAWEEKHGANDVRWIEVRPPEPQPKDGTNAPGPRAPAPGTETTPGTPGTTGPQGGAWPGSPTRPERGPGVPGRP